MTYRALIVDDERLGRQKIRSMIADHEDFEIVGECANGTEALAEIRRHKPDLVFLDVQMPGSDAFEVIRKLRGDHMPAIIFVTAHDEYALQAFEVEAVDYLLKPFDRRRFNEALRRVQHRIESGGRRGVDGKILEVIGRLSKRKWSRFIVKSRDRMVFVPAKQVDWIEAEGKNVRLHVGGVTHLIRDSIGEVETRLDEQEFMRIHRKSIVNLRSVVEMHRGVGGDYVVVLRGGARVPASRRYWSRLKHFGIST